MLMKDFTVVLTLTKLSNKNFWKKKTSDRYIHLKNTIKLK